jgi:uncharacterized membrane protein YeiH
VLAGRRRGENEPRRDRENVRIETITTALDLAGVFASALLGGAAARSRRLDLFAYVVIGLMSGLGGGVIRDLLLQHGPPAALVNPVYIPAALAGTGLAFILDVSRHGWDRGLVVVDAAALSVWAAAGAQKTLAAGLGWLPAVLLGTLTAVGGGAARDLMLQRVPAVFGGNALYASVAVLVASIQVLCTGSRRAGHRDHHRRAVRRAAAPGGMPAGLEAAARPGLAAAARPRPG